MQRKDVSHEDDVRKKEKKKREKRRGEIVELFWKGRRKPQRRALEISHQSDEKITAAERKKINST